MAKPVVKMKSIRETFIYSMLDKNGEFSTNIKTLLTKGVVPTSKQLEQAITTINAYYKYTLKTVVMDAYEKGIVRPMMFPKGITAQHKIPSCLPFILVPPKDGGTVPDVVAVIDNYAQFDKDNGIVSIDKQKFYTFLEGAFIARGLNVVFPSIKTNNIMLKECANIWAHMFTRPLNKKYALNVNRTAHQAIMFLAAKFFILNLLRAPQSDAVDNYARYAAKYEAQYTDVTLNRINKAFAPTESNNSFENIATFIEAIGKNGHMLTSGIGEITVRDYIKDFISMYSNAALFSLESLP